MTEKISVIVPVYNSEATVVQTAEAILDCTYRDIELILVDDGSTDESLRIIRELAERDERIVICTKKNGGPSSARNEGLRLAVGKYIVFCDADDVPHPDMYERLYEGLCESGADVALCDIYSERNKAPLGFPWHTDKFFKAAEVGELIAAMVGNASDGCEASPVWGSVCRGLYRTDIIRKYGIFFPEDIRFAEDLVFSIRYLKRTSCAVIINEPLYTYRDSAGSIMNSYFSYKPNMLSERIRLVNCLLEEIEGLENYEALGQRLYVTERCYYHECVGNACRPSYGRGKRESLSELRELLNTAQVRNAFRHTVSPKPRKRTIYTLIRLRAARILYFYYKRQFKKRTV